MSSEERLFNYGSKVCVDTAYKASFPRDRFSSYEDFVTIPGDSIREQSRTSVRRIDIKRASADAAPLACVLKTYRYPHISGGRTLGAMSKAEREFRALSRCASSGAPVARPVAFGTRRNALGFVTSCFVVTEYLDGFTTLWDWLHQGRPHDNAERSRLSTLVQECGSTLRAQHLQRFFLFTFAAKNILVRPDSDGSLDWHFLDLPYARSLKPGPLARWGQRRDLGALAGPILSFAGEDAFEAFYGSYLPDPLGASENAVRRQVHRGARIYNKQTPLTKAIKTVKRAYAGALS